MELLHSYTQSNRVSSSPRGPWNWANLCFWAPWGKVHAPVSFLHPVDFSQESISDLFTIFLTSKAFTSVLWWKQVLASPGSSSLHKMLNFQLFTQFRLTMWPRLLTLSAFSQVHFWSETRHILSKRQASRHCWKGSSFLLWQNRDSHQQWAGFYWCSKCSKGNKQCSIIRPYPISRKPRAHWHVDTKGPGNVSCGNQIRRPVCGKRSWGSFPYFHMAPVIFWSPAFVVFLLVEVSNSWYLILVWALVHIHFDFILRSWWILGENIRLVFDTPNEGRYNRASVLLV